MSLTNFPNGISSFGVPIIGGGVAVAPGRLGRVVYVDQANGNDALDGTSPERGVLTLSRAHALMTANRDDVALVFGSTSTIAVRESAALAWSKDKCHIIGMNAFNRISHRVSIRATSGATVFTPLVNVTADGCLFANFHVFHGFADDSAQIAWVDTGERNAYYNIHIGGGGATLAGAHAGMRCLKLGGSGKGEHYFRDCTIGLDTVSYDAANANLEIVGGAPRIKFENCDFIASTGSSGAGREFVLLGVGAIDRYLTFKDCRFINAAQSGATTMTQAMSVNASAGGLVLLDNSWVHGCTDIETSASGNVFITNPVVDTADGGIPIVNAPS